MIVESPAKINLFLHVTGKRPDRFHELFSLMVALDLADRLFLEFSGKGISVSCSHPEVPLDRSNLVWKAADLFSRQYADLTGALPFEGLHVGIDKIIPVGGGLGGGSSNGAAVLWALNRHLNHPFSKQELMEMGLSLGADLPFFLHFFFHGSAAYARGVGERLEVCRDLPDLFVLLCCPGIASSTAAVFKKLEFGLTFHPDYIKNTGLNVLPAGQGPEEWDWLRNDLERPACELYPEIGSAKEEMGSLLQQRVFMSGSGSSLFALFSDHGRAMQGFGLLSEAWSGRRKVFLARAMHKDRRV